MNEKAVSPILRLDLEASRIGVSIATLARLREQAQQCPTINSALRAVEYGDMQLAEALAQAALVASDLTRTLTEKAVQQSMLMRSPVTGR